MKPWDWMKVTIDEGERGYAGLSPGACQHVDNVEEEDPAKEM